MRLSIKFLEFSMLFFNEISVQNEWIKWEFHGRKTEQSPTIDDKSFHTLFWHIYFIFAVFNEADRCDFVCVMQSFFCFLFIYCFPFIIELLWLMCSNHLLLCYMTFFSAVCVPLVPKHLSNCDDLHFLVLVICENFQVLITCNVSFASKKHWVNLLDLSSCN